MPPSHIYQLGLKKRDLIPVVSKMRAAGGQDLGVIRAAVLKFSAPTSDGSVVWTKQLCYVCTAVDRVYLSKQALYDL